MLSKKEISVEFLQLCAKGDSRKAFKMYAGGDFKHHNPYFRGDSQSLIVAMEQAAKQTPDRTFEVIRALEDGNMVAVHSRVKSDENDLGIALVHFLKFEGDKIIEIWDLNQTVPDKMVNEFGMF